MLAHYLGQSAVYVWRFYSRVEYYSDVIPARFSRARLDAAVQSSVALLGVIRCLAPIGRAAEQLLGELRKDGAIALVMSG